jgi:bla regulator protein blaR1
MLAALATHLWQSTLFAAVVALLALAFREHRARLRYALWFAASIKFLVPFAALAALGSLVAWQQPPAAIRAVVASPAVRDFNAPFAEVWLDPTAVAAPTWQPPWLAPLLFGIWACGFAAIVIRRVKQWREIRAAVRTSTLFATATTVPAGIELRTAATVIEPSVVGLRRPVILLPDGIESYLTADQFTAVVAHEVCHVRRRDNLTAAIHMLVEAIFWFHPIAWWIGARLIATREQACDEHVVAETAEPIAYAEGIVSVCRRYVETPHMAVAGVGGADIKGRIDAILANRIGVRLTRPKRLVLATAAVMTLALPIVTGAIDAAAFAAGQLPGAAPDGPQVDPEKRFEVVSIKPFDPSGGATPRSETRGTRYDFFGLPLRWVVAQAFRSPLDGSRLVGLPEWIDERYAIAGTIPDGVPVSALPVLLTNLLKDRFKMVAHTETREMPVYNLVLARNDRRLGPSLTESSAECRAAIAARNAAPQRGASQPPTASGGCPPPVLNIGLISQGGIPMAVLAQSLRQMVSGRPVIDRTGLTGYYDYTLKWMPEPGIGPPGPPVDPDAPNVFTAVQEQLGLKLEAARGPVEVVVIDRLEKPTFD